MTRFGSGPLGRSSRLRRRSALLLAIPGASRRRVWHHGRTDKAVLQRSVRTVLHWRGSFTRIAVAAAREVGWNAIHYTGTDKLADIAAELRLFA